MKRRRLKVGTNETEIVNKDIKDLENLGFRIKKKSVKYIHNKGEVIGMKIYFEIERKQMI